LLDPVILPGGANGENQDLEAAVFRGGKKNTLSFCLRGGGDFSKDYHVKGKEFIYVEIWGG